jgi:hypothetical protein
MASNLKFLSLHSPLFHYPPFHRKNLGKMHRKHSHLMPTYHQTNIKEIKDEYDRIEASTLLEWANHPSIGTSRELPSGYFKFGISVGSHFQPIERLKPLFREIEDIAATDTNHVPIPSTCYHFTFLALAGHHFDENQLLPPEIDDLKKVYRISFSDLDTWKLDHLRLLPGRNFLLLVGTPSIELVERRERFAKALMDSPWRSFIESRHEYRGYPFPPKIWHTTLCRYKADFLPTETRQLFERYRDQNFGSIELEKPKLRKVNYDWSSTSLLS